MKRAFAILGAGLFVALGLFLPRLTAAYQDQSLAGNVRRMENAAVSLTLAQELVPLEDLDLFESLSLFYAHVTAVELEEGRYTTEEDVLRIADELADCVNAVAYVSRDSKVEAAPYLLTDENGKSGIFWRFGWTDRPGESVWIDDRNSSLMGFCLDVPTQPVEGLCQTVCSRFFPPYISQNIVPGGSDAYILLFRGGDAAALPVYYTVDGPYFNLYFHFNMPYPSDESPSGEASMEAVLPSS